MAENHSGHLRKFLRPIHLWGIAVGLVISGEYFGWSYGWAAAGTVGFLVSTLMVAVLYTTFVFSFTELTTAIPQSGGAYAYASRAIGPMAGFIAGYSSLIEFLFAPPAIALALGSYVHFVFPSISVLSGAVGVFVGFSLINILGIQYTARFELALTLIAVGELILFIGLVVPHFQVRNFLADPCYLGVGGVFAAIPYAVWFFLAIEGVAMSAEEVENPQRDIPLGYISGIITLIVFAIGVMLAAGGAGDWKKLSQMDYPIPEALAMALGQESPYVKLLAGIGIFGLVASLNGIIYSSSRQVFALAREGLLPKVFAVVNRRFQSPHWAVVFSLIVGVLALLSGKTSELITIAGMGAISMYILSMVSLFALRVREAKLHRPYRVPFYPLFPAIALVLSGVSLLAMFYYNVMLALIFLALNIVGVVFYRMTAA